MGKNCTIKPRERDAIVDALGSGVPVGEIAERFGRSRKTVLNLRRLNFDFKMVPKSLNRQVVNTI